MDTIRQAIKLADMDALIKGYRAALAAPYITTRPLKVDGRVVLDVEERGDKWNVVMRGVTGGSIEVRAPAAAGGRVANPFCNPNAAKRMEFWFTHTACWCDLFVGGRIRRCNATSEIVNNVMKNNSMKENTARMAGHYKLTSSLLTALCFHA